MVAAPLNSPQNQNPGGVNHHVLSTIIKNGYLFCRIIIFVVFLVKAPMISPISLVYVRLVSGLLIITPLTQSPARILWPQRSQKKQYIYIYIYSAAEWRCVCGVNSEAKCQQPTVCLRLQFCSWMPAATGVSGASILQPTVRLRSQFRS